VYGLQKLGGDCLGCDVEQGDGVDVVFDFALPVQRFQEEWQYDTFSTIAIFNVLEHTFDPIRVLQNAPGLLRPKGSLLVVTPAIWNLHRFPRDYVRLLPDWYREFAQQFDLSIHPEAFCWLSEFGITQIKDLDGTFPNFLTLGSPLRRWISRVIHKLFNTYGRSHTLANIAIGVAFVNECRDRNI
jgi:SAM-dependent methyltransferase